MVTLSVFIIYSSENSNILSCLESIKGIADELGIIHTVLTDPLPSGIEEYTSNIFKTSFREIADTCNLRFAEATSDFILWLDARDQLTMEDRQKLLKLKETLDPAIDAVTMVYNYTPHPSVNGVYNVRRNFLVKTSARYQWHPSIHPYMTVEGNVLDSDIVIMHPLGNASLDKELLYLENTLEMGKSLSPKELYIYANKLVDYGLYEKAYDDYIEILQANNLDPLYKISCCDRLADLYHRWGQEERELESILKSFQYGTPRAELCCRLGFHFLNKKDLKNAIFWYELVTQLEEPPSQSFFYYEACWTWLPHLQLCVCYAQAGEYQKAYTHNEAARRFLADDERVLHNKAFLEKKLAASAMVPGEEPTTAKARLRIVQIAPEYYPVPPKNYGGIERVVYTLTEELVKKGHEVYLYAPNGSTSSAKIIPYGHTIGNAADLQRFIQETLPSDVDILHDHTHDSTIGQSNLGIPTVCTIHCIKKNPVPFPVYVSQHALETTGENHGFSVHNALDPEEYEFCASKDDYLLFLSAVAIHKGAHHALEVAQKTNQKLIMAGPIFDPQYFKEELEPHFKKNPNLLYVGQVGGHQRLDLLKNAKCMLFPTLCEEPFGLVMIESMVCGTPVLALANGAVPEVMVGFPELVCQSVDEMAEKLLTLSLPNPYHLRSYVLENFTTSMMADRYVALYRKIIGQYRSG